MEFTEDLLTRLNNDVNGNPRFAVHYIYLVNEADKKEAVRLSQMTKPFKFPIEHEYDIVVKKANKFGGRKYHNKQFGGGIVFQMYKSELLNSLPNILAS